MLPNDQKTPQPIKKIKLASILFYHKKQEELKPSKRQQQGPLYSVYTPDCFSVFFIHSSSTFPANSEITHLLPENKIECISEDKDYQNYSTKGINIYRIVDQQGNSNDKKTMQTKLLLFNKSKIDKKITRKAFRLQGDPKICLIQYDNDSNPNTLSQFISNWQQLQKTTSAKRSIVLITINKENTRNQFNNLQKLLQIADTHKICYLELNHSQNFNDKILPMLLLVKSCLFGSQQQYKVLNTKISLQIQQLKTKLFYITYSPISQLYTIWMRAIQQIIQLIEPMFDIISKIINNGISKLIQSAQFYKQFQKIQIQINQYSIINNFLQELTRSQDIQENQNISNILGVNTSFRERADIMKQLYESQLKKMQDAQKCFNDMATYDSQFSEYWKEFETKLELLDEKYKAIFEFKEKWKYYKFEDGEHNPLSNRQRQGDREQKLLLRFRTLAQDQSQQINKLLLQTKQNKEQIQKFTTHIKNTKNNEISSQKTHANGIQLLISIFISTKLKSKENNQKQIQVNHQLQHHLSEFAIIKEHNFANIHKIKNFISDHNMKRLSDNDFSGKYLSDQLRIKEHNFKILNSMVNDDRKKSQISKN